LADRYGRILGDLRTKGLLRRLELHPGGMLEFSSNDYLNLSTHPDLKNAAAGAVMRNGCSASASRLMSGNLSLHEELERELADMTGMESALLFGSGFLANVGVLNAVAGRDDVIFADRLNHASLVDGALVSRARVVRYTHGDTEHLEELLSGTECRGRRFIVTDSLFSMDGDRAPLKKLDELSKRFGCDLVVDEAHAVGVFGEGGGLCVEQGIRPRILVGTLSKALGSYGGFIACDSVIREFLVNRARTFIYSTGLPPASVAAGKAAVNLVRSHPSMGKKLLEKAAVFRGMLKKRGFSTDPSESQIVPLVIGAGDDALAVAGRLRREGVSAVAIRPPTVPAGTARIRFSVTLAHSRADLERVVSAVAGIGGIAR